LPSGGGKPISESLLSVKIPCIFVPPENRFQYIWKMLIPDQQSLIIPNDSAILEVHRDTHPVAFECDTIEHDELIASVKYTVYTTAELETRRFKKPSTDIVLVFVLITGFALEGRMMCELQKVVAVCSSTKQKHSYRLVSLADKRENKISSTARCF
uniref:Sperm acrosome associated 1 n=1 Tax=Pseudonaja textilis TaxID=8673 RepID=A0A670YRU6_PSETE